MTTMHRGHVLKLVAPDTWVYEDTGELVSDNPYRACGYCKRPNTPEGHDPCLGTLPGVMNACCGHGHGVPYVQFPDGSDVRGEEARELQQRLVVGG